MDLAGTSVVQISTYSAAAGRCCVSITSSANVVRRLLEKFKATSETDSDLHDSSSSDESRDFDRVLPVHHFHCGIVTVELRAT